MWSKTLGFTPGTAATTTPRPAPHLELNTDRGKQAAQLREDPVPPMQPRFRSPRGLLQAPPRRRRLPLLLERLPLLEQLPDALAFPASLLHPPGSGSARAAHQTLRAAVFYPGGAVGRACILRGVGGPGVPLVYWRERCAHLNLFVAASAAAVAVAASAVAPSQSFVPVHRSEAKAAAPPVGTCVRLEPSILRAPPWRSAPFRTVEPASWLDRPASFRSATSR